MRVSTISLESHLLWCEGFDCFEWVCSLFEWGLLFVDCEGFNYLARCCSSGSVRVGLFVVRVGSIVRCCEGFDCFVGVPSTLL